MKGIVGIIIAVTSLFIAFKYFNINIKSPEPFMVAVVCYIGTMVGSDMLSEVVNNKINKILSKSKSQ